MLVKPTNSVLEVLVACVHLEDQLVRVVVHWGVHGGVDMREVVMLACEGAVLVVLTYIITK